MAEGEIKISTLDKILNAVTAATERSLLEVETFVEEEDGVIHAVDKNGYPVALMSKKTYNSLKESNMTVEELAEQIINEHLPLLEISKVLGTNEAYSRGAAMLTAQARLTNCWKQLADESVLAKASEEQAYNAALQIAEGKDAEARKASAKANIVYLKAKEKVNLLENNTMYLQSFMRQFENGYRIFMNMTKNGLE